MEDLIKMEDIIKKFRFKAAGVVLEAPDKLKEKFVKLGFKTSLDKKKKNTNTLVFIRNMKDYQKFLQNELANIEEDSVLWFAYPKLTSVLKSDVNRDIIRVTGEEYGITTVTAVSIDDTWSALRFRPINKVGK